MTRSSCPSRVASNFPVATSHSFTSRSGLPVASNASSGLNATELTSIRCPLRVAFAFPVATSQRMTSPG